MRDLARDRAFRKTQYNSPIGYAPLRRQLAVRLGERGVAASPEQIVLTESTARGSTSRIRFLVQPGDTVAVDDPSYFRLLPLLNAHRVNIVAAPLTPKGPDVAALGDGCSPPARRGVYLTVAALHNPTGASLSGAVAHRMLKLVERHQVVVIEDEIFADFEPGPPGTRLAAFDGLERVIQVGSYSKTVSAALRCGYLALRPDWVEPVVDLKLATSFSSGRFAAAFLYRMLTEAGYRRHLSGLRARLAEAMGTDARAAAGRRLDAVDRAERRHVRLGAVARRARRDPVARLGLRERRGLGARTGVQRFGGSAQFLVQRRGERQPARLRGARPGDGRRRPRARRAVIRPAKFTWVHQICASLENVVRLKGACWVRGRGAQAARPRQERRVRASRDAEEKDTMKKLMILSWA